MEYWLCVEILNLVKWNITAMFEETLSLKQLCANSADNWTYSLMNKILIKTSQDKHFTTA